MREYRVINDTIRWVGDVWHIEVDGKYYAVSRADTFDRGDETMIFPADENCKVTDWGEVYAGYGEDHKTAIENWLDES
jgi:hypothetical protein